MNGLPCPLRAHLRKDSKGGVCSRCRELLVWNGLVDAAPARRHLRALSRKGVGYKTVGDACDVSKTTLFEVLAGRKTKIRAHTLRRILEVDAGARADHATVPAAATWKKIDALLAKGFKKGELARRLGRKTAALQIRRTRVLAKTAHEVERFAASSPAPRRLSRKLPTGKRCTECEGLANRRPRSGCPLCGEPWAPEAVELEVPTSGSSLGALDA